MNIFITGGSGFIGSYIVNELITNGHNVTIFSRNPKKIKGFTNNNSIKFVSGCLEDHKIIENNLAGHDACIHLALGWGNTAVSMLESDTKHSIFLFEACANKNVKQIIYTSSTVAVGEYRKIMDKNSHTRPLDFYGATKAATEAYLLAISNVYEIKCNIMRPEYTFGNPVVTGASMQPDNKFREIVSKAKNNQDINLIKNHGNQFIWAGDIAKMYYNILLSDINRNIFFGAGPDFITWEKIANMTIEYLGSKSKIILEDKGWGFAACLYDSKDVTDIFGMNLNTKEEIFKHIEYIADNC